MSDEQVVSQSASEEQIYYLITTRISQRLRASKIADQIVTRVHCSVQELTARQIRRLVIIQAEEACRDEPRTD
jgi:hypothetical protein